MLEGVLRRVLRAVFGGGGVVDIDLPAEFAALVLALKTAMEMAIDTGEATGGSNTTIVDTGASWATNMWEDATFEVEIGAKRYLGVVISNTATTINFAALADSAIVVSGCKYGLKRPVDIADISDRATRLLGVVDSLTKWGGTDLTGRDISGKGLGFSGAVYENEDTATADAARRFETSSKKLRDVIIQVTTQNQLFGGATNQRYLVTADSAIGFTQVDLSTLYFKNAAAGQHGTVNILGVED